MKWQKNKHPRQPVNLARLTYSGWLCLFLLAALTACSSASPSSAQAAPPTVSIPTGTPPTAAATPSAISSPTVTSLPAATPPPTASPPAVPFTSTTPTVSATVTPLSRTGWKTYVSTKLQIAIDYPPDWSVRENTANVTFVSPQGAMIQLVPVETSGLSPEGWLNRDLLPNTRCSQRTNEHGLTVQICLDTLSFTRTANFVIGSSGTTRLLTLMTIGKGSDAAIFNAMVDSLKPAS